MSTFEPQEIARLVASNRQKDSILYLRLYCESTDCAAREIDVKLKDYDEDLVETLAGRIVRCPVCGSDRVSIHHLRTSDEQKARDDEDAIARVNVLRYIRDRRGAVDEGIAVPVQVMWNTELPP